MMITRYIYIWRRRSSSSSSTVSEMLPCSSFSIGYAGMMMMTTTASDQSLLKSLEPDAGAMIGLRVYGAQAITHSGFVIFSKKPNFGFPDVCLGSI